MRRMVPFDGLATHETDELAMIRSVRDRQAAGRRLRAELLTVEDERVRVRARVHLLESAVESDLRERLAELEDGLALLAHSSLDPSLRDPALANSAQQRAALAAFLAESCPFVDTTVGRPASNGGDWTLADLPWPLVEHADRCYADFRAALVEAVENVVESELLTVRTESARSRDGIAELELTEHDADSVAQIKAFVSDIAMVGRAAAHVSERMRLAALRESVENPRDWLVGAAVRRRRARHALDRSRAIHAALEELARAAELTE